MKNDTEVQRDPLDFIRSGLYNYSSGGINYSNSEGRYWETTPESATYASDFALSSTGLSPQYGSSKGAGCAVRCLVR